jgi:hypothetical protein
MRPFAIPRESSGNGWGKVGDPTLVYPIYSQPGVRLHNGCWGPTFNIIRE